MTHQRKIIVTGARLVPGGVMLTNRIVAQLRELGVDIQDHTTFGGRPASGVIFDEYHGASTKQIADALKLDTHVGTVRGLMSAEEIEAHHRAMVTPFFNDLAG